jgi:MFS family permease
VLFLLIFSCFWLMFMQLFDLLPNFVDEWVDTSDVAPVYQKIGGFFGLSWVLESGQTKPEMIINIDAASIILLVLLVSWLIRKINKVAAMVIGMVIALVGFVGAGYTTLGWLCCLMIFIFAIGEMTCSPTFSAYVALIAPKDKKALYMGYSNIPFAIGWAAGGKVGGWLYEDIASKFKLAREYVVQHLGMTKDAAEQLSNDEVIQKIAASLNHGAGGTVREATKVLWDLHHPYMVWVYLGLFGLVGTVGMIIFYFATKKALSGNNNEEQPAAA